LKKFIYEENIPQILETERLILEPLNMKHKEDIFKHFSDEEVTRYMDIDVLKSIEEVEKIINFYVESIDKKKRYRWSIIRKEDNKFIGTCGFNTWIRQSANKSEIGYDLSKEYWGKGYMSEALEELLNYGFEKLELYRIEAKVINGNDNSRRVLNRLGFTEEGLLRSCNYYKGKYVDEYVYSILRDEWKNKK